LWKHPVYRRIAVIGMTRNAAIQYASAGVCCIAVPIFSPENAAAFDTTNPL
jgi:DNA-binding IclR family transcriptional regulator